jgi:anti-sigma-K factor RskA
VPKDRTFQIWIIDDDVPKPSGLFETREDPVATVIDQPLNGADAVAVSVEPEGGSPKPTTAPMLTAKL